MKIIIILNSPYPRGMALTKRIHLYAKGLSELSNDVEIIIPRATEKEGNIKNEFIKGESDGIKYRYSSKSTVRSKSFFQRRVCDFRALIMMFILIVKRKPDIVLFTGESVSIVLLLKLGSIISRFKIIRERNEIPYFKKESLSLFDKYKTIVYYSLLDGIIVISDNLKDFFQNDLSIKVKLIKVPIIMKSQRELLSSNLISNNVVYTGSLSQHKDGVLTIIKAFSKIYKNNNDLRLVMTGNLEDSNDKLKIQDLIKEQSLERIVLFPGFILEKDLNSLVQSAKVLLFAKPRNRQNRYNSATKIGEYLATGRPVLMTDVDATSEYLENRISAFISKPNIENFTSELQYVLSNPKLANKVGVEGRKKAIQNFNYLEQTKRIHYFLESLL